MAVAGTRPTFAARRAGYAVAVLLDAALLVLVNQWPGWEALPFLTTDTRLVIGLVNASIIVSLAANLVYLAWDPRWLKTLGDAVTTAVGLLAMVRIWQVFPFEFADGSVDWPLIAQVALGLGIAGVAIGIVANAVGLVKAVVAECA